MPTLSQLIENRRGGRSYAKLEDESGGSPSASRWHQLHTKKLEAFPSRPNLEAIARVLGVSNFVVLRSCAESFTEAGYDGWQTGPQSVEILDRLGAYDLSKLRTNRVEAIISVVETMLED